MDKVEIQLDIAQSIARVNLLLFELRDALSELSSELEDWQFETALEQRALAERAAQQLFLEIATLR